MVRRTPVRFAGYECVKLQNNALDLWVTQSVGPRIIGLALTDGANLLAELPDETVACPGGKTFRFRGGHRLWCAPEDPTRTYLPDDDPVAIVEQADGISVIQPVETQTGIQKSLSVCLAGPEARVVIDHRLQNQSAVPVELAPWAITQLRPGGVAILPQTVAPADKHGLLPNRHFALWPYTQINSPYISWGDRYICVAATMQGGALKIGFPNPAGWLAYLVADTLFVKRASYQFGADYFDGGCSSECYGNPRFLELETLGPRVTLGPGESVTHRETWSIWGGISPPLDEEAVDELVADLGLMIGERLP